MLFSLFATLTMAKIKIRTWLRWYLEICAETAAAPKRHLSILTLEDVSRK